MLLDDADTLVKPVLGGLRAFDVSLAYARAHSSSTLWVFAIDAVIWPFLQRARDSRPLFDEYSRSSRGRTNRSESCCRSAARRPRSRLLSRICSTNCLLNADEIDKQEALQAKRAGYFRMVWDYARGNPAMALEVWRASLVADGSELGRVRPLQAPNAAQLESLPESSLFVLRAVLQLAPATLVT